MLKPTPDARAKESPMFKKFALALMLLGTMFAPLAWAQDDSESDDEEMQAGDDAVLDDADAVAADAPVPVAADATQVSGICSWGMAGHQGGGNCCLFDNITPFFRCSGLNSGRREIHLRVARFAQPDRRGRSGVLHLRRRARSSL